MPELRWTSLARRDLRRIDTYLTTEASPEVAERILVTILDKADLLRRFPEAGPIVSVSDFRSLRIGGTPYLLAYRVTPRGVDILRLSHERQNWREPTP